MILPMNAKCCPADKVDALLSDDDYVMEVKIDGYRAIWEDGKMHSRLGNTFPIPMHLPKNVVLDGELYVPGGNSNDVTTALGKDGDVSKLHYAVFDMLGRDGEIFVDKEYQIRRLYLQHLAEALPDIETTKVFTDKLGITSFPSAMKYIEDNGIEGFMLKRRDSKYYPDKRPVNTWWKIKKHLTYDVVVLGFTGGKGKYSGLIGSVKFGLYKGEVLTYCGQCSGFTDGMRDRITKTPETFLGKVMEIAAMERTKDGMFRHPVFRWFRNDKSAKQCKWEEQ